MKSSTAACILAVSHLSLALASPLGEQFIFKNYDDDRAAASSIKTSNDGNEDGPEHDFNVYHHLSGISPFFDSHGPRPEPPEGCVITSASILARHSSITMNDDEFPETIGPFLSKLKKYKKHQKKKEGKKGKKGKKHHAWGESLGFLEHWKTPVNEDNMEQLTGPGARDAKKLGATLANHYEQLVPGRDEPAIKIYTASSQRDVDSSTAFITGMFPNRTLGTSQGQVDLVKVPNKNEDWSFSLTPHKVCDRFDKSQGKKERNAYQEVVAKKAIQRLTEKGELPGWKWNWTDIIAMQQMCGYESVIRDSSEFCKVFTEEEWLEFEYGQDLYYYHMLGRHRKWTAALGIPWIQIAASNLKKTRTQHVIVPPVVPKPTHGLFDILKKNKAEKASSTTTSSSFELPKPTQGPNATLPQAFHIWFTHREEVPLVTHALDLYHGHDEATGAMPLDKVNPTRVWKTSEIIPFLGHVSLERMECAAAGADKKEGDDGEVQAHPYVRIIVNGSPQEQPSCHDGPGGSCPLHQFLELVDDLPSIYGELKEVCQQTEED
ncbi:phosphoglycerate mutase-like protein [Cystobasidium minutum MCA 4210]|uniref:phosphoglycerate mutase-like protein n=1 Tax=Cystobasidium minutum MCA 4210 TaxID=1397322 RepID=UPI0034CE168A|eukprot:jgi/Rhomi1/166403/fgenesh1_kg.1_\